MELDISSELKTIVLEVQINDHTRKLIAIHMPGDRDLRSHQQTSDYCRSYREFYDNSFSHLSKDLGLPKNDYIIRFATGFEYGTLNPISLSLDHPEIVQLFDSSLNAEQSYYTNTGERTSGIKIERLSQLLDAINPGREMVSVTQAGNRHPSAVAHHPTVMPKEKDGMLKT